MSLFEQFDRYETRRQFFARGKNALGYAALTSLLGGSLKLWAENAPKAASNILHPAGGIAGLPHFPPKVKNIIYLHMVGGPSQMDLYDYKAVMKDWYDKDL